MHQIKPSKLAAMVLIAVLAMWGAAARARSSAADVQFYVVTLRQQDHQALKTELHCRQNVLCRKQIYVSTSQGLRTVTVIGMIEAGYAFFRFQADGRPLSCGRPREFVSIPLGRPPTITGCSESLCDFGPPGDSTMMAEPLVLRGMSPPLANLRIEVRSIDQDER